MIRWLNKAVQASNGFTAVLGHVLPVLHKHEKLYLCAYPDPASPMGKALGHKGIVRIGRTGIIPAAVAHLSGHPWTIGWGQTGKDIKPGTKWTKLQADEALFLSVLECFNNIEQLWPGSHSLPAAAQAALVSLVYNRGTSLDKRPNDTLDRRREMRQLGPAILAKDINAMIELFHSMKRLWAGLNLNGLIARREDEIKLLQKGL